MTDTDSKQHREANSPRRFLLWGCTILFAVLMILFAVCLPFINNYQAIQHFENQGCYFDFSEGTILKAIPEDWENWIESKGGNAIITSCKQVEFISLGYSKWTNEDLLYLKNFKKLHSLKLNSDLITDAGFIHIKRLKNLTDLHLSMTKISDRGLLHLQNLTNLIQLDLDHTRITDEGMPILLSMKHLVALNLNNTDITDQSLIQLEKMTQLKELDVRNTFITESGKNRLEEKLPKCYVYWKPKAENM